jgi:uncharacterized protein involved in outer membrane biogenesis
MKLILKTVAVLLMLVIVVGIVVWIWIDQIAAEGIRRGGTRALGVETYVEDVDVRLVRGTLGIEEFRVANPEGFETPHLLRSGNFDLALDTGSVWSDPIVLREIVLDGLDIHLEQKFTGNNISVVLENIRDLSKKTPPEEQRKKRKIQVDRVEIRNVVVHVSLPELGKRTVEIPAIELAGVTSDNAQGVLISELMARIFTALVAAVLEAGGDDIPATLRTALQIDLATAVSAVNAEKLTSQARKHIESLGKDMRRRAEGAATRAIGDLFGDDK